MKKIPIEVIVITILIIFCALFAWYKLDTVTKKREQSNINKIENFDTKKVACTMDAKVCPDGSSVGRVAPSCEFEICLGIKQEDKIIIPNPTPTQSDKVIIDADNSGPIPRPKIIPHTPIVITASFDKNINAKLNDTIKFPDGLSIIIKKINDGRCPQGVMCIWAGEVTIYFEINGNNFNKYEVILSTLTKKDLNIGEFNGYKISLVSADTNNVTFLVSKQ
jgi:hypothetical protein